MITWGRERAAVDEKDRCRRRRLHAFKLVGIWEREVLKRLNAQNELPIETVSLKTFAHSFSTTVSNQVDIDSKQSLDR